MRAKLQKATDSVAAKVSKLRAELNTARAQAERHGPWLLERQMALQLEEERERRVQHLGQLGIKRMTNHNLLGWSAWIEMYENCVRQRNMLKAAASRLTKPSSSLASNIGSRIGLQPWLRRSFGCQQDTGGGVARGQQSGPSCRV